MRLFWGVFLLFALVFIALGVGFGAWELPWHMDELTWQIRYPRVMGAALVGACLCMAGSGLQAIFQNPLADPSLIGTSSGAALGAVLALWLSALGIFEVSVAFAAFIGALLICALILSFHRLFGGGQIALLLLGFVVSAFCAALVSLILFLSDDLVLRSATNWLSGSLAELGIVPISHILVAMALGGLALFFVADKLDILMLGDSTAMSMGVDVARVRVLGVVGAALLTAAAVSLAGVIGFIGMMIPNLLAQTLGGRRVYLLGYSALYGAILLLGIDTITRATSYPIDVPVGIVLALLGAPFFMWIFVRSLRG